MVLAMRAMAVAAGMRQELVSMTVFTLHFHQWTVLVPATLQCAETVALRREQLFAIVAQEIFLELFNNRGQADHRTAPHVSEK